MSLHVFPQIEQRSDAWYDQRRGMVTASAVGQLVTPGTLKVASNDVSRSLTMLLVAERITGFTEPTFINSDMWRGIEDEPRAVETYAEHYGVEVTTTGFMVNDDSGYSLGYSPDGLVDDDGLLEVKCPRAKGHLATILADRVPPQHVAQCQAGLLVSGREWIDFISFCGGMPMFVKRMTPDPKWQTAILAALEQFELTAAEMVATYTERTAGLPVPERLTNSDEIWT